MNIKDGWKGGWTTPWGIEFDKYGTPWLRKWQSENLENMPLGTFQVHVKPVEGGVKASFRMTTTKYQKEYKRTKKEPEQYKAMGDVPVLEIVHSKLWGGKYVGHCSERWTKKSRPAVKQDYATGVNVFGTAYRPSTPEDFPVVRHVGWVQPSSFAVDQGGTIWLFDSCLKNPELRRQYLSPTYDPKCPIKLTLEGGQYVIDVKEVPDEFLRWMLTPTLNDSSYYSNIDCKKVRSRQHLLIAEKTKEMTLTVNGLEVALDELKKDLGLQQKRKEEFIETILKQLMGEDEKKEVKNTTKNWEFKLKYDENGRPFYEEVTPPPPAKIEKPKEEMTYVERLQRGKNPLNLPQEWAYEGGYVDALKGLSLDQLDTEIQRLEGSEVSGRSGFKTYMSGLFAVSLSVSGFLFSSGALLTMGIVFLCVTMLAFTIKTARDLNDSTEW